MKVEEKSRSTISRHVIISTALSSDRCDETSKGLKTDISLGYLIIWIELN